MAPSQKTELGPRTWLCLHLGNEPLDIKVGKAGAWPQRWEQWVLELTSVSHQRAVLGHVNVPENCVNRAWLPSA